jgi:hypothetical protein
MRKIKHKYHFIDMHTNKASPLNYIVAFSMVLPNGKRYGSYIEYNDASTKFGQLSALVACKHNILNSVLQEKQL